MPVLQLRRQEQFCDHERDSQKLIIFASNISGSEKILTVSEFIVRWISKKKFHCASDGLLLQTLTHIVQLQRREQFCDRERDSQKLIIISSTILAMESFVAHFMGNDWFSWIFQPSLVTQGRYKHGFAGFNVNHQFWKVFSTTHQRGDRLTLLSVSIYSSFKWL